MPKSKKSNLLKTIDSILFEDTWNKYGSEYMSHPVDQKDYEDTTVPPSLPIQALDQMATQLTVERPPVEDPNYIPDGVEELSRAADALAMQVPRDQVSFFYEKLKDALELAMENENNPETVTNAKEEEEAAEAAVSVEKLEPGIEESKNLRKYLHYLLREQSDWSEIKFGSQYDDEPEDWELEAEEQAGKSNKDTIKGKHIAKYYGKSGPSGVSNATDRLMQNFLAPLFEVPSEDLVDARDYIRFHYQEHATGDEPRGSEQAFVSYVLKKVVKDQLKKNANLTQVLLPAVVQHVKEMPDSNFAKLIDKAAAESESEIKASQDLADMLREEDPEQFEVLQDLGLA